MTSASFLEEWAALWITQTTKKEAEVFFSSGDLVASELYDHQTDPLESVNVVSDPTRPAAVDECQRLYRAGFPK